MGDTTAAILEWLRSRGDVVKEFRVNDTVEFHAVPFSGEGAQVARCNDGADDAVAVQGRVHAGQGRGGRTSAMKWDAFMATDRGVVPQNVPQA
jgi:hypothetical protein